MSEKSTTTRLTQRRPPVFHVNAIEISPNAGSDHIALRFVTPCNVCFEFRIETGVSLELSVELEKAFQKKSGLHA